MLEFESRGRTREVETEPLTYDGDLYTIYKPKEITIAKFASARSKDDRRNVALLFEFLSAIFDEDGQRKLLERMDNPHDSFDVDDLSGLVTKLLDHWGMGDADTGQAPAKKTAPQRPKKTAAKKTTPPRTE